MSATRTSSTGLDPRAHALTVFRALSNGEGRAYTATTFPQDPWQGCEHFIRQCLAVGWLSRRASAASYAVLDVLDAEGDIVQDYGVETPDAFQRIKRRLNLVVESDAA